MKSIEIQYAINNRSAMCYDFIPAGYEEEVALLDALRDGLVFEDGMTLNDPRRRHSLAEIGEVLSYANPPRLLYLLVGKYGEEDTPFYRENLAQRCRVRGEV